MSSSLKNLPWVEPFLQQIEADYNRPPPSYKLIEPTQESIAYVYSIAETPDKFDSAGLKAECGKALRQKKATILECVSPLGSILVVSLNRSPTKPSWNLWWRCVRLLIPSSKKVRILLFGHPKERIAPYKYQPITNEHLNGGSAYRCNPMSIVLYRKEEVTRVLIHELFHASCSDPYHLDTPQIEADTEAWAELFLCGMAAKGKLQPWIRYLREQIAWAVRQAATVEVDHNVHSSGEYAWRYLVGRLAVWRRLGISVPAYPNIFKRVESLRFSLIEPEDT